MERKCSQTVKIPFPTNIFYGSETTVEIPKIADMIKRIRIVTTSTEIPIEKIELITKTETLETLYGEFIHVENNFKTPCEKRDALQALISSGYLDIPFESIKNGLFTYDDLFLRILFKNDQNYSKIDCYLLVDYYITDKKPDTPFVQKTTHVNNFNTIASSASKINMSVYVPGPVYEVYFTVKDEYGNYVDAVKNISLYFPTERFNLSGDYLRSIEPVKRNGIYPVEPMYMYSFGVDDVSPCSTYFGDDTFFIIDLYDNNKTYYINIWLKSHDFLYIKEDSMKRMFISNETLLDVNIEKTDIKNIPLKVSYINYSDTIQVFYKSDYDISNVEITDTNISSYTIKQNSILFTKIDSKYSEYYANVIFSSTGFVDTLCCFNIIGKKLYLEKINYNSDGKYPTHIDASQRFHYVYGNTFDFNYNIFDSEITKYVVTDESKNFIFSTYTASQSNIYGTSYRFPGNGSILSKYDQNMNLISYSTFPNSAKVILNNYGDYCVSYGSNATTPVSTINANGADITLKDFDGQYMTSSISGSDTGILYGNIFSTFGMKTYRSVLFSNTSMIIVSNVIQESSSVKTLNNGDYIWSFMNSLNSFISDNSVSFTSNGYCIKTSKWNIQISNVSSSPVTSSYSLHDRNTDCTYISFGFQNTTPEIPNYTIQGGTGYLVLKINSSGKILYTLSIIGSLLNIFQHMVDESTGTYMINITTSVSSLLRVYKNGILTYSDTGKYQFFIFDDLGNINGNSIDYNTLFSINRNDYITPFQNSEYFKTPSYINYNNYYWVSALSGSVNSELSYIAPVNYGVFVTYIGGGYSNVYDVKGDTLNTLRTSDTSINGFIIKFFNNGVFSNVSKITNVKSGSTGFIAEKLNNVYSAYTTFNGTVKAYNPDGTNINIFSAPSSDNLVIVKHNQLTNMYANWFMNVENSNSSTITFDSQNNMYIVGNKLVPNSSNVFINGVKVAELPETVASQTIFFIKLNQNDSYVCMGFIENVNGGWVVVNPLTFDIYLGGTKTTSTSNINGNSSTVLPPTLTNSCCIVKFDNVGNYNSWYALLTGVYTNTQLSMYGLKYSSTSNIFFSYNIGNLGANLYINGTQQTLIPAITNIAGGGVVKLSNENFKWYTNFGGSQILGVNEIDVDSYDNVYIPGSKQVGPLTIINNGTQIGTIPATASDAGWILRINSDGTYSNCYGYGDTGNYDNILKIKIDRNGDFYVLGRFNLFRSLPKTLYVYDKFGYSTYKNLDTYNTIYGGIIKYNSNFTTNKISL